MKTFKPCISSINKDSAFVHQFLVTGTKNASCFVRETRTYQTKKTFQPCKGACSSASVSVNNISIPAKSTPALNPKAPRKQKGIVFKIHGVVVRLFPKDKAVTVKTTEDSFIVQIS